MVGSFSGDSSCCFSVLSLYIISFHNVSLQLADFVWTFRWLLVRLGLLALGGLCFIVLGRPKCRFISY
jgi:hypothetical protein